MKKSVKNLFLGAVALTTASATNLVLANNTGSTFFTKGNSDVSEISGASGQVDSAAQTIVSNVTGFLVILAVLYGIWGGIRIMTAAGNDDQVGEGKKIIIQSLIGMVVIYLAGSVVQWLVGAILK